MFINTNVGAMNAHRNLSANNTAMNKTMEKLSSGYRINRAADDAAGLAISEKMRFQINGLQQAQRNAQDGISLIQTAEGALTEVHAMLQRMNTLANQASNGTYASQDKSAIQREVSQLIGEIDAIAERTSFNGISLLNNTDSLVFQVGVASSDVISVARGEMDATTLEINDIDVTDDAAGAIEKIKDAIKTVSEQRATFGAVQNRLEHTINNLGVNIENLSAAHSRVRDADMAQEMTSFTKNQILVQAGTSMLAQANSVPQNVLKLLG